MENSGRQLLKNTIWLTIAETTIMVSGFFISIILARHLGDIQFGKFIFIFSFANLFLFLSDFGISQLAVREVARDPKQSSSFLSQGLYLKFGSGLMTLGLIGFIIFIFTGFKSLQWLTILGALYMILTSFSDFFRAFFRAYQKMHFEAASKSVQSILLFALIGVAVHYQQNLSVIILIYLVVALATLLLTILIFHIKISRLRFESLNHSIITTLIKKGWLFALSSVFVMIYYYIDAVMLKFLQGDQVVGWYGAAYKLILLIIAGAGIIINAIFPSLSKTFVESKIEFMNLIRIFSKLLMFLAIPIGIGGTILASKIIILLYGETYIQSALTFQILVWSVVILYMNSIFAIGLSASNRQKIYLKAVAAGALINFFLNLILIPKFGFVGAAATTVFTELVVSIYMTVNFLKFHFFPFWKPAIKIILSGLIMAFGVYYLQHLNLFFVVLNGIILYSLSFFLLGGVSKDEIRMIFSTLTKKTITISHE